MTFGEPPPGGSGQRPPEVPKTRGPEWKVLAGSKEGLKVPESDGDLKAAFLAARDARATDRMSMTGLRNGEEKRMLIDDVSPFFEIGLGVSNFSDGMNFIKRTGKFPPLAYVFNSAAVVGLSPSEGSFYLCTYDARENSEFSPEDTIRIRQLGKNGVHHIGRGDLPTPNSEANLEVSSQHGELTIDFNRTSVTYKDTSKNGSSLVVHEPATSATLEDMAAGIKREEPRFRVANRQQVHEEKIDKQGGLN